MSKVRDEFEDEPLWSRIRKNPRPAIAWAVPMAILVAVEFGALVGAVMGLPWDMIVGGLADNLPGALASALTGLGAFLAGFGDQLANLPTLLDRSIIPNQGYNPPGPGWEGTFLGLPPAYAWAIRLVLVYAYGFFLLYWAWRGYLVFRENYRYADWTPTDDVVDRLRGHRWGQFGLVIVTMFIIMAMFAPTVGPTTVDRNVANPYQNNVQHWDEDAGEVGNVTVGQANLASASKGDSQNFGIGSYDPYGRFHPFGTMDNGKDLFTFMAAGARVSLFIGLTASAIAGGIALGLALLTAYYKGILDLVAVVTSDSFMSMPRLLVLIMLSVVLSGTWIAQLYSRAVLIALLFGIWGWPALWRAVRGPAFQTVENEWIDAAESFGQKPRVLVRKHVAPYVIGYLLIYLSMSLGGYMIGTAGLSFLGLGVQSPTPEWGRAVNTGQEYITSASWHISILPGLAITLVVVAFNALGDGIRDAIDPKSEGANADEVAAAGGGA
jgi:peptide/nickel transport system permease protein